MQKIFFFSSLLILKQENVLMLLANKAVDSNYRNIFINIYCTCTAAPLSLSHPSGCCYTVLDWMRG